MKIALIVLPSYNEAANIVGVIEEIFAVKYNENIWDLQILVADDNSPDGTAQLVANLQKKYPKKLYLISGKKEGLGKAYCRAFEYAIQNISPFVIFEMDADGQHDPISIGPMLDKIATGADFVIGSRYIKGGSLPQHWSFHRRLISQMGSILARITYMKPAIHDWSNGFRAIRTWFLAQVLPQMHETTNYVFQISLLDKAIKAHLNIAEVPAIFRERSGGNSKFNSFQYMWDTTLYTLLHSTFLRFVFVALVGFVIDLGGTYILHEIFLFEVIRSNIISMELAIISNFVLNNFWSFSHRRIEHKWHKYLIKFLHFNFISLGSIVIQTVLLMLLLSTFGNSVIFSLSNFTVKSWMLFKVLIIAIVIVPYSYFMYNRFIWKAKK